MYLCCLAVPRREKKTSLTVADACLQKIFLCLGYISSSSSSSSSFGFGSW
jgi:hypothetical protein